MDIEVMEHIVRKLVIAPYGRVDAFNIKELSERWDALLEDGVVNFVIDLSDVTFLDSAGIAALVSLLKKSRKDGGDTKLVWPRLADAQRILRLTKFDRVFEMFDSAELALA